MKLNPFKRQADTEDSEVADTDSKTTDAGWFLPEDSRKSITKLFETLREPIALEAYTQPGENDAHNDFLLKFARDIANLSSGKITLHEHSLDSDAAKEWGVDFSPTLLVAPDRYHIAYRGAPLGEEGRSFMQILMHISRRNSGLTDISREMLKELEEEREIKVFVNPSCPYCPGQVLHAFRIAVERPDLVRAVCIDSSQDPDTADRYDVGSVPHTVVNDSFDSLGLLQEERFVLETLALRTVEDLAAETREKGRVEGLELPGRIAEELARAEEDEHEHHHEHMDVEQMDCVIIGAGPAGLTAGIYAERSGMHAVVLEKDIVGGAVALTPVVENYPGFASVAGKNLMDIMSAHAREYCDIREGEEVREIKIGKNVEVYTNRAVYVTKALLLTTGATWRRLDVTGADRFFGHGVNYCAACDGYLYKNKKVVIVGGGNTALTDALHLKNLGVDVTIVHRRDAFRAQQHLQDSVAEAGIPVLWNTVVKEVLGNEDDKVRAVVLENVMDGAMHEMELDGVFVAIGINPNNQLAQDLGIELDDNGFVKVDRGMRTNIPRIYAAGDLTGGVQQIVTAIGEGSVAAISAFEDIAHPYWKKKAS